MFNKIIANNLKEFRSSRSWSLARAAAETGVSKAMLGQIERGESSPTMATLWKITQGFHLPMSVLLEPHSSSPQALEHQSKKQLSFDDNLQFRVLFAFDPTLRSEMFSHQMAPGKTHLSDPHEIGVIEDIIVIEGALEIKFTEQWQLLLAGETLRFKADQEHGYRNSTAEIVIFHNVIHYPKTIADH
ncbi:MAG: hypothetical protein OFPI_33670 [Osedax symbiont Rs2]|nr:MAG: hypothetical protein OFPI_33670 [Osedax symbiont Rs2]